MNSADAVNKTFEVNETEQQGDTDWQKLFNNLQPDH
jgi:hypothetical protein